VATSNFKVFDPNKANMIDDAAYENSLYRQNGVTPGIAPSAMHNKMFYQWSMMCAAFGHFVADQGFEASDADLAQLKNNITQALLFLAGNSVLFWQPNATYAVGDIVYSKTIGMSKYFYCTQGGISAAVEPDWAETGQMTADNAVRWVTYSGGTAMDALKVGGQTLQQIITQVTQTIPANAVSVLTGEIAHGGTIPLPAGYTQSQCKWTVSKRRLNSGKYSDETILADANRVVTCRDATDGPGTANYLIIGIKGVV
jgi:hypothetical protein